MDTGGWREESYDEGTAGGWGEASFVDGDEGRISGERSEKFPFPTSVKDLSRLPSSAEKITVGKFSFTMLRTVGQLKAVVQADRGQTVEYTLADFHDPDVEFLVIHYKGVVANGFANSEVFSEGVDLSVVGKLRSFSDRLCIVAFDVSLLFRIISNKKF
ncbi:unnamed protein product [Gongylonema pulchrum]|uniref:Uncharacterized protein n=1 Tax=Gongylonema pulchrum TaxID=637853 RepID=A0A183E4X3_9BILA|nr:unnamed protein product [Gongylonema pulchrum]